MAVDVITGKPINPNLKGQRTGVDIDFDPTEWQRQWELGEAGDVGGVEAAAIQSIKDALAQRHAGNEYYSIDQQGLKDYYAAENVRTGGNYVPTAADLATTGDTRLQNEASRIFREQLMGGYNPNIDYRAEGVTPNVFLRSGEGLDTWEAMGRPTAESGPRGVPLGYGVPEMPTPITAQPPTTMGAPAATTAAPASTRQTTSVTQPDAAAAAAAEVDPAIAQREIIEKALAAKLKPIQNALAAGLLDVQAAQLAWDSARSEIYGDFLTEQTGVQQGFQTQQEADEAKRLAGRTKLLQDLNAAGVDSGMVADELALIDAIAEGSGQERMGLIGDMGRIGLMSNADRRMMGEGIFGGYEQDLRSQARQATLGAELDAAGQIQTAEERALSAGRLSDYMGIPVEALMADLYSDIDLTGMATGREEMEWGTSERIGGQDWQSAENVLNRTFATDEREAVQEFTTDERIASQNWAHDESIDQRDWQSAEAATGRTFSTTEREAIQDFNRLERMMSEQFTAGESATARNWQSIWNAADLAQQREQLALQTAAQEEQIRQFGVGETWQDRQFDEQQRQFNVGVRADAAANVRSQNQWQQTFDQSVSAQDQNLAVQQLTAGIDPATGQYLAYDPADPYAAFSPQEQYTAMTENQLPLTALLPQLAETPADQQKIAEFMGQFATATAMGQEITDEAVITALASSPDLMHLIPQLMSLQMQDWRTQMPTGGGLTGGATGAGTTTPTFTPPTTGYDTGAGNLSESEIMNQDLVDLIVGGQTGYGSDFEWGEGWTGDVGDVGAGVLGSLQGDSYTSPSGTEYGGNQLEQIAKSAIPVGTTVQEWIDWMESRGKTWGYRNGFFGWG